MLISGKSEAPDALLRPLAGSIYTFVDPEFGYSFAFAADGRSAPVVNVVAPDPQRLTFVRPVIWCEEKAKTCSADGVMMIAFSSLSESGGALPWTMRVRIRAGDAGLIPRPSATFTATVGDISYNKLAQRK